MTSSILHVETYGDGEPVLAVHGISGFGARFARLAAQLPDRRWLCPDLRGHGSSPARAPWRTEEHVADLLRVLDDLRVDRADLVAHSFAGHVALHMVAAAPERVRRLVLIDPASIIDPDHAEAGALSYARDPGWASREDAVAEITTWFPNEESEPDLRLEVEHNLVDDGGRWRMRYSPAVIVAAYGEMARPLPPLPKGHDVLLLEADPRHTTVSAPLRQGLQTAFGERLRRQVVPGATHVVFRTALDATAEALRRFWSATGG